MIRVAALPLTLATLSLCALVPSAPASASNSSGTTNGLAATTSTASTLSGIDSTSLSEQLLSTLLQGAGQKVGGQIAGWALDSIFGSSAQGSEQLKKEIDALQNQMIDLKNQVHDLSVQLDNALKMLMTQLERDTYDGVAAQVNLDAATLADYQIQLDSWLKQAPGTPVDGSQSSELQTMRSTLGIIINHLNLAMVGAPGSRGLIEIYGSVVRSQDPYSVDPFYTSDFTTPVSNQLDYYTDLIVQAFYMLAEVYHLSWTSGGVIFAANDALVENYANLVPTMLANWNQMATSGVGRLPDNVVADTATGLMWTRSSLAFDGTNVTTTTRTKFDYTTNFCWGPPPCDLGAFHALSTFLTPTTVIDGLSGWTVPTQTQFAALVAGQGRNAFKYLTANGFQWRINSGFFLSTAIPIPAYWVNGGVASVVFLGGSLTFRGTDYWPANQVGPGAVAVRRFR